MNILEQKVIRAWHMMALWMVHVPRMYRQEGPAYFLLASVSCSFSIHATHDVPFVMHQPLTSILLRVRMSALCMCIWWVACKQHAVTYVCTHFLALLLLLLYKICRKTIFWWNRVASNNMAFIVRTDRQKKILTVRWNIERSGYTETKSIIVVCV